MHKRKAVLLFLFSIIINVSSFSQGLGKAEVKKTRKEMNKKGNLFDWIALDTFSKGAIAHIEQVNIQGLWKAYNGIFNFNGSVNSMSLFQPFIIEMKNDAFRRSSDSEFEKYSLQGNELVSQSRKDIGFINLLTEKLFVITWKDNDNYTRYYYEKPE